MSENNLAWIDLETTGLSPEFDAILEIGVIITTKKHLEVVQQESWVFSPSLNVSIGDIDPYVWEMHTKNGLWLESINSRVSLISIESEVIKFIKQNTVASPACGSSIHFDRGFLKNQAPEINAAFNYRNIDVSTVKNLVEIHHPGIFESRPLPSKKHRALDDLQNSIAELKYYMTELGWLP